MFTDTVATRSEEGNRVLLGARRPFSPGSLRCKQTWHPRSPDARARVMATVNLEGAVEAVPGCARPRGSGSGDVRRVPAAARAGRAPRAAGRGPGRRARLPGGWAAAARRGRRVLLPAGQRWPGLGALSPHLSRRARRPRGASREGSARWGHPPRRGLAVSAGGSPRAPPGRPGALGPTRLGYGAGEVWGRGGSGERAAPRGRAGVCVGVGWWWMCWLAPGVFGSPWGSECPPRALRPALGAG